MKLIKPLIIALTMALAFSCANNKQDKLEALLLVNKGGSIDDASFNQMVWSGLNNFFKGNVKKFYYQVASDSERNTLLLVSDEQRAKLIIAPGFAFHDAFKNLIDTARYHNQYYLTMDIEEDFKQPNILQYVFKEDEGSFLAGVLAASEAKQLGLASKFGFIGGMQSEVLSRFEEGYKAGILAILPKATIEVFYTGDWGDSVNAKIMAQKWYNEGVFAIMTAAGAGNGGAISAASEAYLAGNKNVFTIGVDSDIYEMGLMPDDHSVVLTSMVKGLDKVTQDALMQLENGQFKGGFKTVGLAEDAVYISNKNKVIAPSSWLVVEEYKEKLLQGQITSR